MHRPICRPHDRPIEKGVEFKGVVVQQPLWEVEWSAGGLRHAPRASRLLDHDSQPHCPDPPELPDRKSGRSGSRDPAGSLRACLSSRARPLHPVPPGPRILFLGRCQGGWGRDSHDSLKARLSHSSCQDISGTPTCSLKGQSSVESGQSSPNYDDGVSSRPLKGRLPDCMWHVSSPDQGGACQPHAPHRAHSVHGMGDYCTVRHLRSDVTRGGWCRERPPWHCAMLGCATSSTILHGLPAIMSSILRQVGEGDRASDEYRAVPPVIKDDLFLSLPDYKTWGAGTVGCVPRPHSKTVGKCNNHRLHGHIKLTLVGNSNLTSRFEVLYSPTDSNTPARWYLPDTTCV